MVKNVGYIFSEKLISISNLLPVHKERSTFIHELISSYELFEKMEIMEPIPATKKELLTYHSKEYIEKFENEEQDEGEEEIFENIFEYIQFVAGSTLTACRALIQREMNICINWEVN
jgi:acetoin utilization deacetylase AcuC-like enzyme